MARIKDKDREKAADLITPFIVAQETTAEVGKDLVAAIAQAIANARAEQSVESALAELRDMFPNPDVHVRVRDSRTLHDGTERRVLIEVAMWECEGATPAKAMAKVRKWAASHPASTAPLSSTITDCGDDEWKLIAYYESEEDAEAALNLLRHAPADQPAWQPIGTAPEATVCDPIIVADIRDYGPVRCALVRKTKGGLFTVSGGDQCKHWATHWMPVQL
jgi:hypothetical protein